MKSILSIQSHVAYGYVGNKAAVYPLQSMGYDVWPVNTVQFSNHTGYGKWKGDVFSREHIKNVIKGIEELGVIDQCHGILSGYMGSAEICEEVYETVKRFKAINPKLIYLCDPVIGRNNCYVKPEVLEFFKKNLRADIITPNQYEAEILSGIKITNLEELQRAAEFLHSLKIKIVVITGIKFQTDPNGLLVFVSDGTQSHIIQAKEYKFKTPINGTGDLFSATFLGSSLANNNPPQALQLAVYYIQRVLENTMKAEAKELQVLSIDYSRTSDNLPVIRPLSKLASVAKCEEHTEHRTAVYTEVHEDSSTGATTQLASEVEFRKRSIQSVPKK